MRILHTSDWHLGKSLKNYSRIPEQEQFIKELCEICDAQKIDLVIIAGDIYDTYNPPIEAENLFFRAMDKLTETGCVVLIIAGNHDSGQKLLAADPLLLPRGVIVAVAHDSGIQPADYGRFGITKTGGGFIELKIKDEAAVILTVPYPSEKRLNQIIYNIDVSGDEKSDQNDMRISYSEKVRQIMAEAAVSFRSDTVNIIVGHFYVAACEPAGTEAEERVGGIYMVDADAFPEAQYIAMGHLHRPQHIGKNSLYSGSPIQYSKSEANQSKCVYIADIKAGKEAEIEKILLRNYRPIEVWKVDYVKEAMELCEINKESSALVYIEIKNDKTVTQSELKQMYETKSGIIEIEFSSLTDSIDGLPDADFEEESILTQFMSFYKSVRKQDPSEAMVKLFLEMSGEDETGTVED